MNKVVQLFWGQFFDYVFFLLKPSHILFISYSFLIHFLFNYQFLFISYSIPIHFLFISFSLTKRIQSQNPQSPIPKSPIHLPIQNPAHSAQYICQYKIQPIVPNTFSNKESIAHKESLHNQLKKFISFPSIVEGGGLLIPSQH